MSRTNHLLRCSFPALLAMTTTSIWESRLGDLSESKTLAVNCQVSTFGFYSYSLRGKGMLSLWEPCIVVRRSCSK